MKYTFDSREIEKGDCFVALKGEKADGRDFIPAAKEKGAAEIIEGLEALHDAARAKRMRLKATVVALTGSAGKTTTKELLRAFLSKAGRTYATQGNFNNHIGLPLTILNCPEDAEFLVLEMGTNHPGEIAALCDIAEPDAALITGIGTAHLEFFKTREAIAEEKGTLAARAKTFCVYPAADDFAAHLAGRCREAVPAPAQIEGLLEGVEFGAPHFAENAALAFTLASRFGVTKEDARSALEGFSLPGARWRIAEKWGATFIDDTYNANPDSMIAALDALEKTPCDGRRIAVLGDMFELGEESAALHKKVFAHAMKKGFHLVVGIGEESSKCLCNLAYKNVATLKKRFRVDVSAGDVVLLKASHAMKLGTLIEE